MLQKMNWENVPNYKVTRTDMSEFRDFSDEKLMSILKKFFKFGVLDGCDLSVGNGLEITVSDGSVFFQIDNIYVEVEESTINLAAADVDNPRYDKVECYFIEVDNRVEENDKGIDVVVTQFLKANLRVIQGAPAVNPVAPPTTAGSISLGICRVDANEVQLEASDLITDERYRDIGRPKNLKSVSLDLANNATTILPVLVDSTKHVFISVTYLATRSAGASELNEYGEVILSYNSKATAWALSNPSRVDDADIAFEVNADKYLECVSGDLAGAGYLGTLEIIDIKRVEKV